MALKIVRLHCKRCGHRWFPRQTRLPKQCPQCHSPNWNKTRKKPKAAKAKKR